MKDKVALRRLLKKARAYSLSREAQKAFLAEAERLGLDTTDYGMRPGKLTDDIQERLYGR